MRKKSVIIRHLISILKSQFMCVDYRGAFVSITDFFFLSKVVTNVENPSVKMFPHVLTWAVGLSSTEPSVTNICPLHWKMLKGLSCTVSHLGPQNEIWFYIIELIYGTSLRFSWKLWCNWAKKKKKLIWFLEFRMPFVFILFPRLSKKWKWFTHPCDVSNVYALILAWSFSYKSCP